MKVSISWLKEYVSFDISPRELADKLTMIGLEVETIIDRYEYLKTVIAGKINSINFHPNADKLRLCNVDIGEKTLKIVCGADNINIGDMVPLALPGTIFPDGNVLKEGEIRGERSQGMLCSEKELEIGDDDEGIMILDKKTFPGILLSEALNLSDMIFEIGLTPNRSDCTSIIGIAREVAALTNSEVKYPEIKISDSGDDIKAQTSVTIESPEFCSRYAASLITNIKVNKSPFWLRDRLASIGLRSINNIVDITNYIMMETGQPLHAFDFDLLEENRIVVRTATKGEKFLSLDNQERILTENNLMICDGKKPVAIGGVMGGFNSEIKLDTKKVLLESAYFNPVSIRKTSKQLGLSTDASYRFERGADPEGTVNALKRATQLIIEVCNAQMVRGIIDERPKIIKSPVIDLSIKKTHRLLGIYPDDLTIEKCLKSIEFQAVKRDDDTITVIPPSYRVDVTRPEDLMEEIARLVGYNTIPITSPVVPVVALKPSINIEVKNILKQIFMGFGFREVINYSFISASSVDKIRLGKDDYRQKAVKLLNPLTEDQAVMRTSIVPGLIENMRFNIFQQNKTIRIFEIGKIFIEKSSDQLPDEEEIIAGLISGNRSELTWYSKEAKYDFYDIKGITDELLKKLKIKNVKYRKIINENFPYLKSGSSAEIIINNDPIGVIGELHPMVKNNYDLRQAGYIFEIKYKKLLENIPEKTKYEQLPKYPSTARDLTLIIDKNIEVLNVLDAMKKNEQELVESISLLDVYKGKPIPDDKKSVLLRLTYRSQKQTLKDKKINQIHKDLCSFVIEKFGADLP